MPKYSSEQDLNSFLDAIKDEAKGARGDLEKNIADNLNQFRGKQWAGKTVPIFANNIIESSIEDKVGKLSETRPNISVLPNVNGLDGVAEILTKAVTGIWDRRKIEYKAERIALWGAIAGVAFVGTPWNNDLSGGLGDVDFVIKDPRACGVDACITNPEDTDLGEYTYVEDFVPLDMLGYQFPGRGALVKANAKISGYDTTKSQTDARSLIRGTWTRMFKKSEPEKASAIPKAIIEEFFIADRRRSIEDTGVVPVVEDLTKWADDGGIPFPGGRRILRAGDIILEDCYNPFWDGAPDIDMMGWKMDPETAWSADEIRSVKRMQESINRIGDAISKSTLLNAVVRVVMDSGALSPTERNKLSNEVGQIIEKAPGRELQYQVPPVLPPEVSQWLTVLISFIREKIGVAEPPLAKQLPSIVTGPAIQNLQVMLQTSIRTAARRLEDFWQRIGQKMVSRVIQYYLSDRVIHLVGPTNDWTKFEFKRLNLIKDKNGKLRSQEDLRKAYKDFYFAVEPGSSLAISKLQRAQAKMMLVQMGLLAPVELLSEFYRNSEEKLAAAQAARASGQYDVMQNSKGQPTSQLDNSGLAA